MVVITCLTSAKIMDSDKKQTNFTDTDIIFQV